MKEVPLTAQPREDVGKGPARRARMEGAVPAVLYGPEVDPKPIVIDAKELRKAFKAAAGATAIFSLEVAGKENKAIIREMQRDPVTSRILHVDFHAIAMNKPLHLSIPIHFIGTPTGVKNEGGIMQTVLREVEISCLPKDIPEHVEVNVADLAIGDSIHVENLEIPNVEILTELRRTVVVISAPTVVKVAEPAEGEGLEGEEAEAAEGEETAEGEGDTKEAEGGEDKKGE